LPPLEAWEKYFISDPAVLNQECFKEGCIACHGGVGGSDDMDEAHQGLVESASDNPQETCGSSDCHQDIADLNDTNLHFNLGGYDTILSARGADFDDPAMSQAFDNHCIECHSDCGQCHVSRPKYAGGGLLAGHQFKKIAPPTITCDGCHGTRASPEYKGHYDGIPADIHWTQGGMACLSCHPVSDVHGEGGETPAHRYDGPPTPSCISSDCHADLEDIEIEQHTIHGDKVACQVCHSAGEYKNCANCHVGTDENGLPFRTLDPSWLDFKIGLNPNPTEDRPWHYEMVRHVPVTPDTFAHYGENLLPNFDAVPTWKPAIPHNTQKNTPQTETCEACHENADIFLMASDVTPEEQAANAAVIVPELPSTAGSIGDLETMPGAMLHPVEGYSYCVGCHLPGAANEIPHPLEKRADCFFCHQKGVGEAPQFSVNHLQFSIDDCQECHQLTEMPDPSIGQETLAQIPAELEEAHRAENPPLTEDEIQCVTCYECHEDVTREWSLTPHSGSAHTEGFSQAFEEAGQPTDCLQCHTSGYDEGTGEYTFEGICCEACHGQLAENHGEEGVEEEMFIPVDDKTCAECHEFTHNEWLVSGHADAGVSCINCHTSHNQGTRLPVEQLCQACHQERLDSYAHVSHYDLEEGEVSCVDCHMHASDPDSKLIGGTGAVGHNFFVGAETCDRCHEEETHAKLQIIQEENHANGAVSQLSVELETAQYENVSLRKMGIVNLGVGVGVGALVGIAFMVLVLFVTRRRAS